MRSIVLIDCERQPDRLTSHYYSATMTEPIGLLYLESFLTAHGVPVQVLRQPLSTNDITLIEDADIVGISGLTYAWPIMLEVARFVRKHNPNAIIVGGREHATCTPGSVLDKDEFDLVIAGEGEMGLLALAQGKPWCQVPGAVYRNQADGALQYTLRPDRLDCESVHPLKRRSEWMVNMFQETLPRHKQQAGIVMGRGCVFKCSFCTAPRMWNGYASQGVENAASEIVRTHAQYGVEYFAMHDLMLNANRQETEMFCRHIIDLDLDLSFFGFLSATSIPIDMKLMRTAGFHEFGIGIEIPGPRRMDIGKRFSFETVRKFFEAASEAGVFTKAYTIIGWPWDTDEDTLVERYVQALRTVPVNNLRITFVTPFPGTETFDQWRHHIPFELTDEAYARFTTMEPILDFGLSPESLLRARDRILRGYLSSPEYDKLIRKQSHLGVIDEMNAAMRQWAVLNDVVAA